MAISVALAEAQGLLLIVLDGELRNDTAQDIWGVLMRLAANLPPYATIIDFSGVTVFDVSSDMIREFALSRPFGPEQPPRIFVAPQNVVFGMLRMFELRSSTRRNLHVVRSMAEAYKMIGVGSPEFTPLPIPGSQEETR